MSKKQKSSSEPWKDIQPYLLDTAEAGADLFAKGGLAPDPVGFGGVTRQGLSGIAGLARNNPITAAAAGGLGDFLGAPSFGDIPLNGGIEQVRENVLDTTLPAVASMFGQGGLPNSTTAQQVAADAVTSRLAPYEYDQYNRNLDSSRDQFNRERQQQLSGLSLAPSINSLQYGDEQALLGVGQLRDQNRQDRANRGSDEVMQAAQLFSQLGGLGQSNSQSPSTLDTLGGLGQLGTNAALAFSLFCDRRVKRDITRAGTWRGVALYTFRYLWDDVLRIGPMAQEVPERARIKVGDFYAVDLRAI